MIDVPETQDSQRERGPVAVDDNGSDEQHPAWCSQEHCWMTDEGVRVHQQVPTRWQGACVVPLWFVTSLIDPADDDTTYLELCMRDLKMRDQFYGLLTLDTARQMRDQLTEHLDAVQ